MILFVHLLNDQSGSPKVLTSVIDSLCADDRTSRLYVGSDGAGCLDECNLSISRYWYKRSRNRYITLFSYLFSQCSLFVRLLSSSDIPKKATVYVNTLLPFGGALYGYLTGRNVIYHLHEISVQPPLLRWFLTKIAGFTASKLIYVSEFHKNSLPIKGATASVLHNSVKSTFVIKAQRSRYQHRRKGCFNILMLASLRNYKGIPEFIELAHRFSLSQSIEFILVANDDREGIDRYFGYSNIPKNMSIHGRTDDPSRYYSTASLVLNLSRPDLWVETFGLTLLEAMNFGVPTIAPPVGGPIELITHGDEGFLVDSRQLDLLESKILELSNNEALCLRMSIKARARAMEFSHTHFEKSLYEILED